MNMKVEYKNEKVYDYEKDLWLLKKVCEYDKGVVTFLHWFSCILGVNLLVNTSTSRNLMDFDRKL